MKKYNIKCEELQKLIDNFDNMTEVASSLNIPFSSFKRIATNLGLYKPNQGRKGIL